MHLLTSILFLPLIVVASKAI